MLLVRHGQASFGADDYDVLSPTGWEQGRLLGRYLAERGVAPAAVVSGGLRRQRETLAAMTGAAGWDAVPARTDDRWDEFDHLAVVASHPEFAAASAEDDGAGLDRRGFQRLFEAATDRWIAGTLEAAETFTEFGLRARGALTDAARDAGPGATVVVVTSGGVIAALCAGLLDPDLKPGDPALGRLWQRFNTVCVNTGTSRVVVGASGPRLLTFNEHAHLEGEHLTYR